MIPTAVQQQYESLPAEWQQLVADFIAMLAQKAAPPDSSSAVSPAEKPSAQRSTFGMLQGKIRVAEDFDAPLDVT